MTNVTIDTGDLAALAIADETVDAVVAVQVLEYVADVDRALREIRRVTRPGGRLVNVATNWAALFWSGGDPSLTTAVLAAWEQHAFYPNLPVELPGRLHAAGFGGTTQQPITIVNRRFHPNSFSWWAAQLHGRVRARRRHARPERHRRMAFQPRRRRRRGYSLPLVGADTHRRHRPPWHNLTDNEVHAAVT